MHWPFALLMGNGKFAGALRVSKSKRSWQHSCPRCMSYVVKRRFRLIENRSATRTATTSANNNNKTKKTGEKKYVQIIIVKSATRSTCAFVV